MKVHELSQAVMGWQRTPWHVFTANPNFFRPKLFRLWTGMALISIFAKIISYGFGQPASDLQGFTNKSDPPLTRVFDPIRNAGQEGQQLCVCVSLLRGLDPGEFDRAHARRSRCVEFPLHHLIASVTDVVGYYHLVLLGIR